MERELDDIILSLAEQATAVMTGRDLQDTLESLQACKVSLLSDQGILAASLTSLVESELRRRGLS